MRLLVLVEGLTEERFVKSVLGPHLERHGVYCDPKQVTTKYKRGLKLAKGGGPSYANWKKDFERLRKQDPNPDRWFTSMIDLYGLAQLKDEFPGYAECRSVPDPRDRVKCVERAFGKDIGTHHFVPYIQLHESEALVLADPTRLSCEYLDHQEQIGRLVQMANEYESPELIDEGSTTAPSKRIISEIPEYGDEKARVGPLVTQKIGLPTLRQKCSHFDQWIQRLEGLTASG